MTTKTQHTEPRSFRNSLQPTLALLIMLVMTMMTTGKVWGQRDPITKLSDITEPEGNYVLASTFSTVGTPANGIGSTSANPFKGTIDGQLVTITGTWDKPLFDYVEDAVIKNVIIGEASISESGKVGAIAGTAQGTTRIYNCGILNGNVGSNGTSTANNSTDCCGGLVGLLDGQAHVVNCFSYANITGGNSVGGIVGYNNVSSTQSNIEHGVLKATMVMNCMFYGDITGGRTVSPVYGGNNINNLNSGGLNTFNYYAYDELKTKTITNGKYNCALAVEGKYLNRFEFYRLLLNSNKKLAAIYATDDAANANQMAKWVLETADRAIEHPKPYPILKAQGRYPSIINIDAEHANQLTLVNGHPSEEDRNKGGKIGTLSVTIAKPRDWTNAPDGAKLLDEGGNEITESRTISLNRTDKDFGRFNFNYDKVQLPYYNDYGTKNYTGNKVVTGWKITEIKGVENDPYTSDNYDYTKTYASNPSYFDAPNYNFADRKSANKDLYSVSGRVFSQGAYFDVPYGASSITIEPYWGKAAYVADQYFDVVYKSDYTDGQNVSGFGKQYGDNGVTVSINGSNQKVYTSISNALSNLSGVDNATVYDYVVVLVGNLHQSGVPSGGDKPFTMMSVDLDNDHEPDYSLIYHHKSRTAIAPIRFDFLAIPGTAQAQKPNGASLICNFTIFKTKGWFETTNTAFFYTSQVEYENLKDVSKANAPLILLGGVVDQFVSTQSNDVTGKTIYIHVGGNVWINSFGLGTHSDGKKATPHVPVSVTGGEYPSFYLTGTYQPDAAITNDNAECYISGGHFGELAGACLEQIGSNDNTTKGNVHWQIYNADIDNFYGGGINDAKPVKGNITTEIFNSRVGTFCGGPKFGNMPNGKTVNTTAEGCTFDKFFGAGYGGNSYSRKKYYDGVSPAWGSTLQGYFTTDRGKYFDGRTTNCKEGGTGNDQYGKKGPGVATDFDYEFFVWSDGRTGGRFFVKFISFSLAQCNDVNSTLTHCIVNNNFYGGGRLGKVSGTVRSILDDCTVKGNVFGAGYSATLPTIPVRNAGFTKVPNFNSSSGMFEPGEFSGTTDYEWKHKGGYPNNGTVGFLDDDGNYTLEGGNVVTTVDITKNNLGSVGEALLTIKGDCVIGTQGDSTTGNVYGGGDESAVEGNTTVILQGSAQVLGNVYGGGNRGPVQGDSKVNIQDTP